jgi:hypothetical protein
MFCESLPKMQHWTRVPCHLGPCMPPSSRSQPRMKAVQHSHGRDRHTLSKGQAKGWPCMRVSQSDLIEIKIGLVDFLILYF